MPPRKLSHSLWDNFKTGREEHVELTHGKEAGSGKALDARMFRLQVSHNLFNNDSTSTLRLLQSHDGTANVPIQIQQFTIDSQNGACLSGMDALFNLIQCLAIGGT